VSHPPIALRRRAQKSASGSTPAVPTPHPAASWPESGKYSWRAAVAEPLLQRIEELHTTSEIKEEIGFVLTNPQYPTRMSRAGTHVQNPIWKAVPEPTLRRYARVHSPSGHSPPILKHMDLFLIKRLTGEGHAELYTYASPDWKTRLVPFRERLPDDAPNSRSRLNALKLAKHWHVDPHSVKVSPISRKFAVSAKMHPKYGDMMLYVFELCSVIFTTASHFLEQEWCLPIPRRGLSEWCDVRRLRADESAGAVNGDVIRSIYELFQIDLTHVPASRQGAAASL